MIAKLLGRQEEVKVPEHLRDFAEPYLQQYEYLLGVRKAHSLRTPSMQKNVVRRSLQSLERIFQALQAEFEPCVPPAESYCGVVSGEDIGFRIAEVFPRAPHPLEEENQMLRNAIMVYTGLVPPDALEMLKVASRIFGRREIRVYSPNPNDFVGIRPFCDPVMIGRVQYQGDPLYFRIAHWDLEKDFAFLPKKEDQHA